jgi:hypothetical protein
MKPRHLIAGDKPCRLGYVEAVPKKYDKKASSLYTTGAGSYQKQSKSVGLVPSNLTVLATRSKNGMAPADSACSKRWHILKSKGQK